MIETYLVDLDMAQLKEQRSRLEQRECSEEEIRDWLVKSGFYPRIDGMYLAEQPVLDRLDPSVIIAVRPIEQ